MVYGNNTGRLGCWLHQCVLRNTLARSKTVVSTSRDDPVCVTYMVCVPYTVTGQYNFATGQHEWVIERERVLRHVTVVTGWLTLRGSHIYLHRRRRLGIESLRFQSVLVPLLDLPCLALFSGNKIIFKIQIFEIVSIPSSSVSGQLKVVQSHWRL